MKGLKENTALQIRKTSHYIKPLWFGVIMPPNTFKEQTAESTAGVWDWGVWTPSGKDHRGDGLNSHIQTGLQNRCRLLNTENSVPVP